MKSGIELESELWEHTLAYLITSCSSQWGTDDPSVDSMTMGSPELQKPGSIPLSSSASFPGATTMGYGGSLWHGRARLMLGYSDLLTRRRQRAHVESAGKCAPLLATNNVLRRSLEGL